MSMMNLTLRVKKKMKKSLKIASGHLIHVEWLCDREDSDDVSKASSSLVFNQHMQVYDKIKTHH